jgi:hypothetical protein
MEETFIKVLSRVRKDGDYKGEKFLEYLMNKYLVDVDFFVPIMELASLLDPKDLEQLKKLLKK